MSNKVEMPQLGESVIEGTIIRWLKKEGDRVELYEALLEIETEKVTVEVSSPFSGYLLKILAPENSVAKAGDTIALIGASEDNVSASVVEESLSEVRGIDDNRGASISPVAARMAAENKVNTDQVKGTGTGGRITKKDIEAVIQTRHISNAELDPDSVLISPIVGKLVAQYDINLKDIVGSGQRGRVTKQDILAHIQTNLRQEMRQISSVSEEQALRSSQSNNVAGEPITYIRGTKILLTGMRRSIAEHMVRSKRVSAHVTTVIETDMTWVIEHRNTYKEEFASRGEKLTITPYIIKATATALLQHPLVNSSWVDNGIYLHYEINIGMATALDNNGLIVPVISNADEKSLWGIAKAVNDLSERARAGRLSRDEISRGTFTVTNHGVSGSLFATPIINQPQAAILGVGKISNRVIANDGYISIRPMCYLSLTFDHRILDGAGADHFLQSVRLSLENWRNNPVAE